MEKNIKFYADLEDYILCVDEKIIKINFKDKTLNSQKLYDYIFSNTKEFIQLNFDNLLNNSIEDKKFNHLGEKEKKKILSEGNFIYSNIKTLIEEVNNSIPEIINSIQ